MVDFIESMVDNSRMAKNRLIYVAGPYSAPTPEGVDKNIESARQVALKLWVGGYWALCPHLNTARFERAVPNVPNKAYLQGDLEMLAMCDAVMLAPGWIESRGTRGEIAAAMLLGIPIFSSMYDLDVGMPLTDGHFASFIGNAGFWTDWISILHDVLPSSVVWVDFKKRVRAYSEDLRNTPVPTPTAAKNEAPRTAPKPPENVLQEADRLIHGARNADYGHPLDDFTAQALMFTAYLRKRGIVPADKAVTADDVGILEVLVKVARWAGSQKRDNLVDIAGYAGCVEDLMNEMERRKSQPK